MSLKLSDILRLIRNHLNRKTISVTVPESQQYILAARLKLLIDQVLPEVRSEGNLRLPVSYYKDQGVFSVNTMSYPEKQTDIRALSKGELLTVLRSVCSLLTRLHDHGYMLGRDLQAAVACYRREDVCSAALCLLEDPVGRSEGRLLGFCVEEKNADAKRSAEDTPEAIRRKNTGKYGTPGQPEIREDVFSLALMFAELYTGKDMRGSAAQMQCDVIPQSMLPVYGPLDVVLRMGLSSNMALRPDMRDMMSMLSHITAQDVNSFSAEEAIWVQRFRIGGRLSDRHAVHQRFAESYDGRSYAAVFLDHLELDPQSVKAGYVYSVWKPGMEQRLRTTRLILDKSIEWVKRCGAFPGYEMLSVCHTDVVTAQVSQGPLIILSKVRLFQRSLFLLDMRMIDILTAVQCVHDDGAVFGAMSENLFAYDLSNTGAPIQVLDISTVFFPDDPPEWPYLRITEQALSALSPEMHLAGCGYPVPGGITYASDIFSLGVLYHLLLTGEYPVPKTGITAGHAVSFSKETALAVALNRGLDKQHRELILRMMSFVPSDRPDSCSRIAEEIMAFYTG